MSHVTKTIRLGGAAGFSVHAIGNHVISSKTPYTRVELWRNADSEADVLCSVSLRGAKRKDVVDQVRGCLPADLPSDDAAFLTGLVIQAYLDRAI